MPAAPLIPPTTGIHDAPLHKVCINAEWWSHVSGQISRLIYPDEWDGTDSQIDDAIQAIYQLLDVGLPVDDCEDAVTIDYPRHATLWHDEATILTGGALNRASLADNPYFVSNSWYNTITYQATAADGDSFSQYVWLDAGTYTFRVLGAHNASHGKVDWYLDSGIVPFTTQDWYASSLAANIIKSTSLTIPEAGRHTLKGIVNGRNASNTLAYALPLTKYWLEYVP